MTGTTKEVLLGIIAGLAFGAFLKSCVTTPTVHKDVVTGKCVKVIPASSGTCEDLPEQYNIVWVAPMLTREE